VSLYYAEWSTDLKTENVTNGRPYDLSRTVATASTYQPFGAPPAGLGPQIASEVVPAGAIGSFSCHPNAYNYGHPECIEQLTQDTISMNTGFMYGFCKLYKDFVPNNNKTTRGYPFNSGTGLTYTSAAPPNLYGGWSSFSPSFNVVLENLPVANLYGAGVSGANFLALLKTWPTYEFWFKESTPDVADGVWNFAINGLLAGTPTAVVTQTAAWNAAHYPGGGPITGRTWNIGENGFFVNGADLVWSQGLVATAGIGGTQVLSPNNLSANVFPGANIFNCTTGGTASLTGNGPVGVPNQTGILDGSVIWKCAATAAPWKVGSGVGSDTGVHMAQQVSYWDDQPYQMVGTLENAFNFTTRMSDSQVAVFKYREIQPRYRCQAGQWQVLVRTGSVPTGNTMNVFLINPITASATLLYSLAV
jgi:hypothetical protein